MHDERKGVAALTGAASIIGSYGVFVVWISGAFGVGMQNLIRFGGAMLIVSTILAWKAKKRTGAFGPTFKRALGLGSLSRAGKQHVAVVGLLGLGNVIFFTLALTYGHVEVAAAIAILYATSNICSAPFGRIVFGNPITITMAISIGLAVVGLLLYAGESILDLSGGALLAITAGICDAAANSSRKYLGRAIGPVATGFWQYGISVVVLALAVPCLFVAGLEQPVRSEALDWGVGMAIAGYIVVTSALSVLIAYGTQSRALGFSSVILSSQVLFAAGFAFLAFGEVPAPLAWVAFVFLGASAFMASRQPATRPVATAETANP